MELIDLSLVKEKLELKTDGLVFEDKHQLKEYVHENVCDFFEKIAAIKSDVNFMHTARSEYIKNLDEYDKYINNFIAEYQIN